MEKHEEPDILSADHQEVFEGHPFHPKYLFPKVYQGSLEVIFGHLKSNSNTKIVRGQMESNAYVWVILA